MRRRRLLAALLKLAVIPALGAGRPFATAAFAQAPVLQPPVSPDLPPSNNIVGLNVARLRQDRYLQAAADLVNRNGGDWGYVTVVWTADDRDSGAGDLFLRQFVDRCFEYHLRPIVRVATRFDVGSGTWTRPEPDDAERWRGYFERASWPTRPVWVVAGNEPNLGRDWGGQVDAADYARYLAGFLDVFADSEQFKVVNAPLDASNQTEL